VNLGQFETAVAAELGLSTTDEKTVIDDALNQAVQRVLEDTHCYVKETDYTGWDGTSQNYTLDATILDIIEVQLTSTGVTYPLERLSIIDLLERRRSGQTSGSPTRYYAVSGGNLLMFYPAPGTGDTLVVYNVPIPTAMSGSTDDPSTNTFGGVPQILHEAVFFYACSRLASYDDDQTSAQGQRYRDWYDKEITRYREILRKRGGTRNARAVVNDKRRRRAHHTNDIYPAY
jgi:hypothetical protein